MTHAVKPDASIVIEEPRAMGGRGWRNAVRSVVSTLLDTAMPASCVVCRRTGDPICDWCLDSIPPLSTPICDICGVPNLTASGGGGAVCDPCQDAGPDMPRTRPATTFDGTVRIAIHAMKYGDRPDVARRLATLLEGPARAVSVGTRPIVVPVALHERRLDTRGYDQSGLLAAHVARACGWSVAEVLSRVRDTPSQVGLGRNARRRNVAGAFVATMRLDGMHVLLVDDVLTTGATLMEASRACRAVGAASVVATCLACNVAGAITAP